MASIITGNGLGVLSGSLTQLNGAGALGDAAFGQGNERVFVNASTGNLVIQQQDENLIGAGLDTQVLRTYNSQGAMDDDNGDNWRIGFYRSVRLESGAINAADSVVVRVTADGAEQRYAYDASRGAYVSTDGSGAHDTLTYAGGQWTFEQGGGALTELYDASGRLTESQDRDGNRVTYQYNGLGMLTQVNDLASSQTTVLVYGGDNLLDQINTISAGGTQTLTRYAYDGLGRLAQVTVDLSPENGSISDGDTYVTTYTYAGDSLRVASITQSDGTSLAITYIQHNGIYKVRTLTDGAGRTTTFDYSGGGTAQVQTVDADGSVLTDSEQQTQTQDYSLDSGQLSTAGEADHALNAGQLQTTEEQTTTQDHSLDGGALTPGNTVHSLDASQLTDTETQTTSTDYALQGVAAEHYSQDFSTGTDGLYFSHPSHAYQESGRLRVDSGDSANWQNPVIWGQRGYAQADGVVFSSEVTLTGDPQDRGIMVGAQSDAGYGQPGYRRHVVQFHGSTIRARWTDGTSFPTESLGSITEGVTYVVELELSASGSTLYVYQQGQTRADGLSHTLNYTDWSPASFYVETTLGPGVTANTVYLDNVTESSLGSDSYTVQTGDTWSSIAQTLYGSNTVADELQAALGNPTLSAGLALTGLPATLTDTVTTTVNVEPYYEVQSGDTWASIAQALYGTSQVADELAASLGEPALTAGLQLTGFPAELQDTVTESHDLDTASPLLTTTEEQSTSTDHALQGVAVEHYAQDFSADTNGLILNRPAQTYLENGQLRIDSGDGNWELVSVRGQRSYAQSEGVVFSTEVTMGGDATNRQIRLGAHSDAAYGQPGYRRHLAVFDTDRIQVSTWHDEYNFYTEDLGAITEGVTYVVEVELSSAGSTLYIYQQGHGRSSGFSHTTNYTDWTPAYFYAETGLNPGWAANSYYLDNLTESSLGSDSYTVQSGDTWDSIAQTLYGSSNVGDELQAALGNPTLSAGLALTGLPATLTDTVTTTVDVEPYYEVQSGDTWASIAQALYGTSEVADELAAAFANPTLSAGLALEPMPLSLVDDDVVVPAEPYYEVQSGDTWADIAFALYGSTGVAAELEAALGSPSLSAGLQLTGFPSTLTETITTIVTVDPYYTVQSGDTWASIGQALYGTSNVSDELQAALGNPSLTAGSQLTGFPGSLTDDDVVVSPYYSVQAGDTWASIAQALYGSSNVSDELQAALGSPSLTAGSQLTGLPAQLTDTYTVTVAVTPYYTVQSGDTWASIALTVYGDASPEIIDALQGVLGTTTLSVGAQLEVPLTLNYQATLIQSGQMSATDGLGRVTTYLFDEQGRLSEVRAPQTGATQSITQFDYDSDDNLIRSTDGNGHSVDYDYDANGNLLLQRDALGNTVERSYDSQDRLVTETVYLVPDPDGAGSAQPQDPQTTRYAYDSEGHLRFIVDGEGGVTEHQYSSIGQRTVTLRYTQARYSIASLAADEAIGYQALYDWAAVQDRSAAERTDYAYDFRGNLERTTTYARLDSNGNGIADGTESVTQYVYDQRGRLAHKIEPRGAQAANAEHYTSHYVYDGLGRLLSTTDALDRVTATHYDDANQRIVTTAANGLITTSVYSNGGDLISVTDSGAGLDSTTTTYRYDAAGQQRVVISPLGAVKHKIYDEAGRLIGEIAPNGLLTEYVYDNRGQRIETIQYEIAAANMASLLDSNGNPVERYDLSGIRPSGGTNRITRQVYDDAGRLVYSIDPEGYVSERRYDGAGNVIETLRYAQAVSFASQPTLAQVEATLPTVWTEDFDDGRIEGFNQDETGLPSNMALEDGHLAVHTEYSGTSHGTAIYEGPLDYAARVGQTYRAEVTTGDNTNQQYLHIGLDNGGSNSNGTLLREALYIRNGEIRLDRYSNGTGGATTVGAADTNTTYVVEFEIHVGEVRLYVFEKGTSREAGWSDVLTADWDQLRLRIQGFRHPDATLAQVDVDNLARYQGHGPMETIVRREGHTYDAAGRLVASTDATGVSTRNVYDAAGNLIEVIEAQGLPEERRSHLVYNARGQQIFSIDAEGYVNETRYHVNGQVATELRYEERYTGATVTPDALSAWASGRDNRTTSYQYDRNGRLAREINHQGTATDYQYDSVGNLTETTTGIEISGPDDGHATRTSRVRYDLKGRVIAELSPEGVSRITTGMSQAQIDDIWRDWGIRHDYDLSGRRIKTTDQYGHSTLYFYDISGRLRYTVNHLGEVTEQTYNRFGEVQEEIAYFDRITSDTVNPDYAHMTYEEYQTWAVQEEYEGRSVDPYYVGAVNPDYAHMTYEEYQTWAAQEEYEGRSVDPYYLTITQVLTGGLITSDLIEKLSSDDADRQSQATTYTRRGQVATSISDDDRQVRYTYNAFGELVQKDAPGANGQRVLTAYQYDARGLSTAVIQDTLGQARTTTTRYDAFGRAIEQRDAAGNVTTTEYDQLGRVLVSTDPLNHSVRATYDAFGRVMTRTDARGHTTTYSYDESNRSFTITTPEGISTTTVANRYGEEVSVTDGDGYTTTYRYNLDGQLVETLDAHDESTEIRYWRDGRVYEQEDERGVVTRFNYDEVGRLHQRIVDPDGLRLTTTTQYDAQGRVLHETDERGITTRTEYDEAGRVARTIQDFTFNAADGLNIVTEYTYDSANNQISVIEAVGQPEQRQTRYIYDSLNQLRFTVDAEGYVTEHRYDDNGQVVERLRYGRELWDFDGGYGDLHLLNVANYPGAISLDNGRLRLSSEPTSSNTWDAQVRSDFVDYDGFHALSFDFEVGELNSDRGMLIGIDNAGDMGNGTYRRASLYILDGQIRFDGHGQNAQNVAQYFEEVVAGRQYTVDIVKSDAGVTLYVYEKGAERHSGHSLTLDGDGWGNVRFSAYTRFLSTSTGDHVLVDNVALHHDAQTEQRVYDAAGQLRYLIDAEGYVTENVYNANGQVAKTVRYAEKPTIDSTPTEAELSSALINLDHSEDRSEHTVYDRDGRAIFSIDAEGYVTETVYNNRGLVQRKTRYADDVDLSQLGGDPALLDQDAVEGLFNATPAQDRTQRFAYDDLGQLRFSIDAEGYVEETRYTVRGEVAMRIQHAEQIALQDYATADAVPVSYNPVVDRQQAFLYDAAGRLRYSVDGERYVTERRYDATGNVTTVLTYENPVSLDLSDLGAGEFQQTWNVYDRLGRRTHIIDTLGYVKQSFYDAFGNVVQQRRYASEASRIEISQLNDAPQSTDIDLLQSASDQVVDFGYDHLNRKTFEQASGQSGIRNTYNSFGDIEKIARDASGGVQVELRHSLDHQRLSTIDLGPISDPTIRISSIDLGVGAASGSGINITYNPNDSGQHIATYLDDEGNLIEIRLAFDATTSQIPIIENQRILATGVTQSFYPNGPVLRESEDGQLSLVRLNVPEPPYSVTEQVIDEGNITEVAYAGERFSYGFQEQLTRNTNRIAWTKYENGVYSVNALQHFTYLNDAHEVFSSIEAIDNLQIVDAAGTLIGWESNGDLYVAAYDYSGYGGRDPVLQSIQNITDFTAGEIIDYQFSKYGVLIGVKEGDTYSAYIRYFDEFGDDSWSEAYCFSSGNSKPVNFEAAFLGGRDDQFLIWSQDDPANPDNSIVLAKHVQVSDHSAGMWPWVDDNSWQSNPPVTIFEHYNGVDEIRLSVSSFGNGDYEGNLYYARVSIANNQISTSRWYEDGGWESQTPISPFSDSSRIQALALGNESNLGQWYLWKSDSGAVQAGYHDYATEEEELAQSRYIHGYIIEAGDTWDSIANALYGTSDAVSLLQEYAGTTELTEGQYITNLPDSFITGQELSAGVADEIRLYNGHGNLIYRINREGEVTKYSYNGFGELESEVSYATRLDVSSLPEKVEETYLTSHIQEHLGKDRNRLLFYDKNGSVLYEVDPLGFIREKSYDHFGNIVRETEYDVSVDANIQLTLADIDNTVSDTSSNTRRYVYGVEGFLRYSIGGEGEVSEYQRNAFSDEVRTVSHSLRLTDAQIQTIDDNPTGAAEYLRTVVLAGSDDSLNRAQITVMDHNGRVVYSIDALGAVTETNYDFAGRVVSVIEHAQPIDLSQLPTEVEIADISSQLSAAHPLNREQRYIYDDDGRLVYEVSPSGNVVGYQYDGLDQITVERKYAATLSNQNNVLKVTLGSISAFQQTSKYNIYADGNLVASGEVNWQTTDSLHPRLWKDIVVNIRGETPSNVTVEFEGGDANLSVDKIELNGTVYEAEGSNAVFVNTDGATSAGEEDFSELGQLIFDTTSADPLSVDYSSLEAAHILDAMSSDADQITRNVYDPAGRKTHQIHPSGRIIEYTYDSLGNIAQKREYASTIQETSPPFHEIKVRLASQAVIVNNVVYQPQYDIFVNGESVAIGGGVVFPYSTSPEDELRWVEKTVYVQRIDLNEIDVALRNIGSNFNDGMGLYVDWIQVDGRRLDSEGSYSRYSSSGGVESTVGREMLDEEGARLSFDVSDTVAIDEIQDLHSGGINSSLNLFRSRQDHITHYIYDNEDRLSYEIGPANTIQRYSYNGFGQIATETRYARVFTDSEITEFLISDTKEDFIVSASSESDQENTFIYDAKGRQIAFINSLGEIEQHTYNAYGDLVSKIHLATNLNSAEINSLLNSSSPETDLSQYIDDCAKITRHLYDASGRKTHEIDSGGKVTEYTYDIFGQRASERKFYQDIDVNSFVLADDPYEYLLDQHDTRDSYSLFYYDKSGNQVYVAKAVGADIYYLSESEYDTFGNLVRSIVYEQPITGSVAASATSLEAYLPTLRQSGGYRDLILVYGKNNKLRFRIQSLGGDRYIIGEQEYDAFDQNVRTIEYETKLLADLPVSLTEDMMDQLVGNAFDPTLDRVSYQNFDVLGNLTQKVDANGGLEVFEYDSFGNQIAYVNKRGYRWTYVYDNANRLLEERTPGYFGADLESVVTRYTYDSFGNQIVRTDAYGSPEARTTEYQYDALNRQTVILYPDAGRYDEAQDAVVDAGERRRTEVIYDNFGNVVVSKDSATDANKYAVYNALNQLIYEVDKNGFISKYAYDALGNRTSTIRYAARLTGVDLMADSPLTAIEIESHLQTGSEDRTVEYVYDRAGRRTAMLLAAVDGYDPYIGLDYQDIRPETRYVYNAFDQVVKESRRISQSDWASSYTYFDKAGRKVAEVDSGNYLTTYAYDAQGNLLRREQYSSPVPGVVSEAQVPAIPAEQADTWGDNRVEEWAYDHLDRMVLHRWVDVAWGSSTTDGQTSTSSGHLEETFSYDAEGNIVQHVDFMSGVTESTYSRVNQLASVITPEIEVVLKDYDGWYYPNESHRDTRSLETRYSYDRLGNVVREYADQGGAGLDAVDRQYAYDRLGNVVKNVNAEYEESYSAYDLAGNLTREWQRVNQEFEGWSEQDRQQLIETRYTYDYEGQQTSIERRRDDGTYLTESVTYNAFGDIETETLGAYTRTYSYDTAGRVRHDSGEKGVEKVLAYDLLGNITKEVFVGDSATTADDRVIEYRLNTLGQVEEIVQPTVTMATSGEAVTPVKQRRYDRWGNVISEGVGSADDGSYAETRYRYDFRNNVVWQQQPLVDAYDEHGVHSTINPTTSYVYDQRGQLVATVDNDGRASTQGYNASGNLIWQRDASGVFEAYGYDLVGNRVERSDALGNVFKYVRDREGRLLEELGLYEVSTSSGGLYREQLFTAYAYDTAGRRTAERRAHSYLDDNGEWLHDTYTVYDSLGNVVATRKPSLRVAEYDYDDFGNKIYEFDGLNEQHWSYGAYNLLESYTDLGGHERRYLYDDFGRVEREETWLNDVFQNQYREYQYYQTGWVREVNDVSDQTQTDLGQALAQFRNVTYQYDTQSETTTYEYNARGQATREYYANSMRINQGQTGEFRPYSVSRGISANYDSLGRLTSVTSETSDERYTVNSTIRTKTSSGVQALSYWYDAFGNRRRIHSVVQQRDGGGTEINTHWYTYDAANRVLINEGVLDAQNDIVLEVNQGAQYAYDNLGRRYLSLTKTDDTTYRQEEYSYIWTYGQYVSQDYGDRTVTRIGVIENGQLVERTIRESTLQGRIRRELIYDGANVLQHRTVYDYNDATGELDYQTSSDFVNGVESSRTEIDYGYANSHDEAGNLVYYQLRYWTEESGWISQNYDKEYDAAGSYLLTKTTVQRSGFGDGVTRQLYDSRGNLRYVYATGEEPFHRAFVTNASGQTLYRFDGNDAQEYYYLEGNALGESGEINGTEFNVLDIESSGRNTSVSPFRYLVRPGDTLRSIAASVYNDSSLWFVIADANGLASDADLVPNTELQIPNVVSAASNNASTFKAFNPTDIVGDTLPSPEVLPLPKPKGDNCGVIAQIIVIVVAVVATIFTAGAAAVALGAASAGGLFATGAAVLAGSTSLGIGIGAVAAAAFVGGFVGSVAGQLTGMALGVQEDFSFKAAFKGGLTSAFGAVAGAALRGSDLFGKEIINRAGETERVLNHAGVAASGAIGYVSDYAASELAGMDTSFSWAGVAASAVGSYASSQLNRFLGKQGLYGATTDTGQQQFDIGSNSYVPYNEYQASSFLGRVASSYVAGQVSAAAQRAFGVGGVSDWRDMAASAFGNTMANEVVGFAQGIERSQAESRARAVFDTYGNVDPVTAHDIRTSAAGSGGFVSHHYPPMGDRPALSLDRGMADASDPFSRTAYERAYNLEPGVEIDSRPYEIWRELRLREMSAESSQFARFDALGETTGGFGSDGGPLVDQLPIFSSSGVVDGTLWRENSRIFSPEDPSYSVALHAGYDESTIRTHFAELNGRTGSPAAPALFLPSSGETREMMREGILNGLGGAGRSLYQNDDGYRVGVESTLTEALTTGDMVDISSLRDQAVAHAFAVGEAYTLSRPDVLDTVSDYYHDYENAADVLMRDQSLQMRLNGHTSAYLSIDGAGAGMLPPTYRDTLPVVGMQEMGRAFSQQAVMMFAEGALVGKGSGNSGSGRSVVATSVGSRLGDLRRAIFDEIGRGSRAMRDGLLGRPASVGPARTASPQSAAEYARLTEYYRSLDPDYIPSGPRKPGDPVNYEYANRVHPTGVRFTPDGYPDLEPYAINRVEMSQTGNNAVDFRNANIEAGIGAGSQSHYRRFPGFTWHHHQDGRTMLLVPSDVHGAPLSHSGGAEIARKAGGLKQ